MNTYSASIPNGDLFRNLAFLENRTSVDIKHLQLFSIYDENNAILGGTNMVDLYWNGTLWYYKDISDFSRKKAAIKQRMDNGVCDSAYLNENTFVIAEDSGAVRVYQAVEIDEQSELQLLGYVCQHDDSILSVSAFSNQRNIVTGGMDCCLKMWDVEDLIATYSYSFAHLDIITGTDVKPMCSSIFVSVSLDSESLLWDIRRAKPASCIFKKDNCPLSAVSWNTTLENIIAIGTVEGSIAIIDIRQTETPLCESVECDRGVHKLLFNPTPERKEQLACCFDNTLVKVLDTQKELMKIYEDNNHHDFVRGLAWCKDDLYSCSWDANVLKHIVNEYIAFQGR
ncbi:Methylosome protein 50 [Trachymyrmex zeteki]|uniref:Methylosome protein 50 n=1 Tax=Mycetomoellerius zeteki TaxID=64791 RepID=A0A151WT03_9HYME|nr:PREDICTED: methylosome protein 50-like isoform X2 [Trachymyrmex zeteki]KYQ50976.1 Methylosome protein 50 [Trachymyrmex zeteki]